ncbi:MAG TPA: hypothetical protein VMP68_19340 [Candidatus Eisenbacteria bacterium]|nr:hypothetical protein [Candidatus Eisenbacteria bacterium]
MLHFLRTFLAVAIIASPPLALLKPSAEPSAVQKQAESELLTLHKEERQAHFDHNITFLVSHVAPHMLDVRDGRVNRVSPDSVRDKFLQYFKNSRFSAWDDVDPPVVHVSVDGTVAWMILHVRIAYTTTDASGKTTNEDTEGAWMSSYEKQNGTWIMTAVTSTFSAN